MNDLKFYINACNAFDRILNISDHVRINVRYGDLLFVDVHRCLEQWLLEKHVR